MNGRFHVANVNGKPEVVIDVTAIARMVRRSPLGVDVALERLRKKIPAAQFLQIRNLLSDENREQE